MVDLKYKLNGKSRKVMANSAQESNNDNGGYTLRDVEIVQGNNCLEAKADGSENSTASYDEETWEPPEPENPQDDMENSLTCNDDDEDEGVGIAYLGEPTSMSSSKDEVSGNYRFKEEKQRAIEEVMNGKLKGLVGQLLKSVGVSSSDEGDGSWVDIVTSLSWEAASFLKPDANGGKAMDPDGHVKVKCIAAGSRSHSQLFRGLVFKKHAAHKHMPTKLQNPRLLLICGDVGHSINGLSSFVSMDQEKKYLKSLLGLIETCHPNVILVEKMVSRDIQESILAKGMALVLDMKLHRLQRVALCTGSPILSCDNLNGHNLRHCEFIYFERIVEEHDGAGEGGKRPIKTLMFIEGCPTRLGCTILLKGTHSDELKKIKCVTRCAVVMAYNLILETSFLFDQKAMFIQESHGSAFVDSSVPSPEHSTDIPISNGLNDKSTNCLNLESEEFSPLSFKPYNPAVLCGFSAISSSLKKVMGRSFPFKTSAPFQSLSAYLGLNERKPDDEVNKTFSVVCSPEVDENTKIEVKNDSNEMKLLNDGQSLTPFVHLDSNEDKSKAGDNDGKEIQSKDDISAVLDSQSILVLMSSRNALKGTVCQQIHFSHIMFYKNFDIPIGKFLQDNLLNQSRLCETCQELPEAHFYYYAHHNKQLTIQVKRLPQEKRLPGEAEGKLWMWSRCVKCKSDSTKRLLISTTARCLSFGKFLELSLSRYSSTRKLICGCSLDKDYLYFFGLGHMVAMFKYSAVYTYTVSVPSQKLEFDGALRRDWLLEQTKNVHMKCKSLFTEVAKCLKTIRLNKSTLNLGGSIREFSEVEKMLKQEREEFEVNIKNIVSEKGGSDRAAFKLLSLNRLMWDFLIESCVWDRRLYSLHSHDCSRSENGKSLDVDDHLIKEIPISGPLIQGNELDDPHNRYDVPHKVKTPVVDDLRSKSSSDNNSASLHSPVTSFQDSNEWLWNPFAEIRQIGVRDFQNRFLSKFEPVSSSITEYLPTANQLITDEGTRLHIPLGTDNYIVSDYEHEPSSIIACALAFLNDSYMMTEGDYEDGSRKRRVVSKSMESLHGFIHGATLTFPHTFSSSTDSGSVHSTERTSSEESHSSRTPESCSSIEIAMGYAKSFGKEKYSVICYCVNEFRELRNLCGLSELDYIACLSRCRNWDAKGGKSKSFFAKTLDDRFIIKEIKKTELDSFLGFSSRYFKHMRESFESGSQTCLAKVLGIYHVTKINVKSGKEVKHDLMVMENLTYNRNFTRQYDLKGALFARYKSSPDGAGDVLLDQNFVNDMNSSPLYVSNTEKCHLQRAVWNDTSFLNSVNVMDYSLIVGIDSNKREIVCGIIDYLRQYTWDKHLETWMKSSLVVPKNVLPTVISPIEYKKRFRKFMSTYFLSVPDHWCSQQSSDDSTQQNP